MTDACQVVRMGTTPTVNPTTGQETYPETVQYTGPCRVRPNLRDSDAEFGEQQVQVLSHLVSIPVSEADVVPDDVVHVTASDDASLVGKRLRVRAVARGTNITARRLACEEMA